MIKQKLEDIKSELQFAKARYEFELEGCPSGKLLVSHCGTSVRYYVGTRKPDGTYARKGIGKRPELVKQLARKEYLRKALSAIEANLAVIERALAKYQPFTPEDIAEKLSAGYRSLPVDAFSNSMVDVMVFNLDASDAERIASHDAWGRQPYEQDGYMAEGRTLITSRGERMRSKAEVMIAEKLYEFGIAFRYEQPLDLGDGTVVHPDFTFEGAGGQEFYLEYCGLMDNDSYVTAHKRKTALYEAAGIVPWKNVIYLYGQGNEMDMRRVESMIRTQIIPWL